jgi:hypothetical protein
MKRNFVLAALFAVFTISAAAQEKAQPAPPNFAGTWNLDVERSQLGDRSNIESQVMTVTQTADTVKVALSTKRTAAAAMSPGGMPAGSEPGKPRMGGMGGARTSGAFGSGDGPWTYGLDGKDKTAETQGPMGTIPLTLNAKFDGPRLFLSRSSTFKSPRGGEMTVTSNETWEILTDGKTLRIDVLRTSMRGTESTVRIYTKKDQK